MLGSGCLLSALAECGYVNTSFARIAERAGINEG